MKRLMAVLLAGVLGVPALGRTIENFSLAGAIDGENITFALSFSVADVPRGGTVPLVRGDVAYVDGELPRGSELIRMIPRAKKAVKTMPMAESFLVRE